METLGDKKSAKFCTDFYCENCDYVTCRKSSYKDHLLSSKHKKITNGYTMGQNSANILQTCCKNSIKEKFICSCGKEYKHRQGLWRHNKICKIEQTEKSEDPIKQILLPDFTPELIKLITELVKGQNGIQESIVELCKNGTHNTTTSNSHNTNSHNKSFNLQFFLNETCKNAMNITDFVNSLQLQLSDLEKVGELGYVEGISNIIIQNLNALDITLRPVHCTDKKRETMYVKDEDKWEKEDDSNTKLHKLVRKVSNKNIDLITEFKELHPDWKKSTSKVSNKFDKIIIESMGGKGDNDYEKEEKIIKKITKEVLINKEHI
jgi:hypothetical protein